MLKSYDPTQVSKHGHVHGHVMVSEVSVLLVAYSNISNCVYSHPYESTILAIYIASIIVHQLY